MELFCKVAVNLPLKDSIYTYSFSSEQNLSVGDLVEVPIKNRLGKGCILDLTIQEEDISFDPKLIKSVEKKVTDAFSLADSEIHLFKWMSSYYHYSLGKLIFDIIPKIMKRPKDLNKIIGKGNQLDFELSENQKQICDKLISTDLTTFSRHFIHGITGSGKTAVYMQLMNEVIKSGKSVLFLLPEINLTPQFINFFEKYLNTPIYLYHSAVTASDKYGLWKLLHEDNSPKMVLGVRSSIFLPIQNLGLIIVDEEHDSSFKQDDRCPYNARDIAIKKASLLQIPVILGSATPSLESYYNFKTKLPQNYYELRQRIGESILPNIKLIDMRKDDQSNIKTASDMDIWPFHPESIEKIKEALARKEQVLVFINRLGFANYLQCRSCGHQFVCPNCSTTLKYFKNRNTLSCQHCVYAIPMPQHCPECQCMTIMQKGFGTEKIHEVLSGLLKNHTVDRFDRDEIKNFKDLENKLQRFHAGDIDVLVGTQMLSKGHNFERVNMVLILGIDSQLNFPDLRSNEKAYQLLTQISGRSGRFGKESTVIIQTLNPESSIFKIVQDHEFNKFYEEEMQIREICSCPPFAKMAIMYISCRFQKQTIEEAEKIKSFLCGMTNKHFPEVMVLGPRPNGIEKRVNKFTWNILLKSSNLNQLHNAINSFENNYQTPRGITIKLDIDPQIIL